MDASVDRIRNLNDRILESVRQGGESALEAYERTLATIAEYQESASKRGSEWVAGFARAQATFTRELAAASPTAARALRDRMSELTGAATRQPRRVRGKQQPERGARGAVAREQDVPIARYDQLSATEVVSRLRRLSKADLGKVEAYERKHKNRKTVLQRIERLR